MLFYISLTAQVLLPESLLRNGLESMLQMKDSKGVSSSEVTYLIARLVFTCFMSFPKQFRTTLKLSLVSVWSSVLTVNNYWASIACRALFLVLNTQQWTKQMKFAREDKYKNTRNKNTLLVATQTWAHNSHIYTPSKCEEEKLRIGGKRALFSSE